MSDRHPESVLHTALAAKPALAILRGGFVWDEVAQIAALLVKYGFPAIEYTWNSPNAPAVVARLDQEFGTDLLVGAGTILNTSQAGEALNAGAKFFVSPHWSEAVSAAAKEAGLPYLPGVLTPTEVAAASAEGWQLLKLFPGGTGGPAHLRALKGPFDQVDFVVTGGVSASNAGAYFSAGAFAVSIGSAVFKPGAPLEALENGVGALAAAIAERAENP